jgi:hypothetical protein
MKLASNDETLAVNKVLILYLLDQAGRPLTNDTLFQLVLAANNMNYFYFQQFILDLIEQKYITSTIKEGQTLYQITNSGKNTLGFTLDMLPGIIKLQADTNMKKIIETSEEENSIVAEYEPKSDDTFMITCKIVENNETIFEVKTFATSLEQSKLIVNNWKNHSSDIYPKVLEIITKKYDEDNKKDEE